MDTAPTLVPLLPVWLSLGDYDNIFGVRCLANRDFAKQVETDLTLSPLDSEVKASGTKFDVFFGQGDEGEDTNEVLVGLQAAPALREGAGLLQFITQRFGGSVQDTSIPCVALPGGNDNPDTSADASPVASGADVEAAAVEEKKGQEEKNPKKMKVGELREALQSLGLDSKGLKKVLVARLVDAKVGSKRR
jgi:hypothetical protein